MTRRIVATDKMHLTLSKVRVYEFCRCGIIFEQKPGGSLGRKYRWCARCRRSSSRRETIRIMYGDPGAKVPERVIRVGGKVSLAHRTGA